SISQVPRDHGEIAGQSYPPESIAEMAARTGCQSISYTYTEPTVYYEIAKDVMKEAHKRNLYNVWVTNGYMSREMLEDARGLIDAANVDLKAFTDEFYRKYCHSHLQGVLDSLQLMKRMGIWLEVTTLLIPTLNDGAEEVKALAEFIRTALGPETPWHVSRFYPRYKETSLPPTDVEKLRKVRQIGLDAGLLFVYTGNVPMDEGEKTFCPQCGNMVVDRRGYTTRVLAASQGKCRHCGYKLPGVGW
ncbi:MAG: AmmeMemoRadiSam system radical SAM enzyme, partial [Desulfomonilaceae bacterium]